MAGIIVAISIFLVITIAVFFVNTQIKHERKTLRNFYDILFLTKFLVEIENKDIIKSLLRDGETICITRKVRMNHKNIKFSEINLQRKYNICYTFKINNETFEICGSLNTKHKRLMPLFLNTKFELTVKNNKIEIFLNSHFSDFICITSRKTVVQSMWILLDSESSELKEETFLFCSDEEIEATEKIIEEIKSFLSKKKRV